MFVPLLSDAILACSEFMGHFHNHPLLIATGFLGQVLRTAESSWWLSAAPLVGLAMGTWHTWLRGTPEGGVNGQWGRHALIIGAGEDGQTLARHLDQHKQLGYVVKGYIDPNHYADPRLLGKPDQLAQIATKHFIDDVFIAMPSEPDMIDRILSDARKARFNVKVMQQFSADLTGSENCEFIGTLPAVALHDEPIPTTGLAIKRAIDLLLGSALLVFTSPLMLLSALAVKFDSPGPVVYRSWRVGKKGRKFICYKFRTMVENAEELKSQLLELNERDGLFFKIAEDPRLTRSGPFLRKYSLDELPQLWSVIKGDMSLVGPRPPSVDEYDQYSPEHLLRLRVTPGLSGLWQVTARRDPSFQTYLALDLEYLESWSLWLDIKILLRTIPAVLRGGGL